MKTSFDFFFQMFIFMFSTAMPSHRPTNYGDIATIAMFSIVLI